MIRHGDIAICSRGYVGVVTGGKPGGWKGYHLGLDRNLEPTVDKAWGEAWESQNPVVIGHRFEEVNNSLPKNLDTEEFKSAWASWIHYRSSISKPYKSEMSVKQQLGRLSKMGADTAVLAIEHSITQAYQGIFPPKDGKNGRTQQHASAQHDPLAQQHDSGHGIW